MRVLFSREEKAIRDGVSMGQRQYLCIAVEIGNAMNRKVHILGTFIKSCWFISDEWIVNCNCTRDHDHYDFIRWTITRYPSQLYYILPNKAGMAW